MADKPEKKKEEAAPPAAAHGEKPAGGKAGFLKKTPVLLGGVMVLEAVVLFGGFKLLGGGKPQSAEGAEIVTEDAHGGYGGGKGGEKKKTVELNVLDFKAPNKLSGRTFLYDVSIFIVTQGEFEKKVKDTLTEREALIKDRVRTIIAQSDPEKLVGGSEPGLETLRRQVKYQLDEIIGEGMIDEVLVPKCIPIRTDY